MERRARLEHLHGELLRGVRQIFETAYAVEEGAGVSAEWQALCAHFGVALVTPEEREEIRAAQRPLRGAAFMEVRAVTDALVRWARVETRQVAIWDAPPEVERLHERLLRLVDRVGAELAIAYKSAVLPKPKGMFGNVLAHHDPSAPGGATAPYAHALRCRTCGGPRLKTTDLVCAFCDQPMA